MTTLTKATDEELQAEIAKRIEEKNKSLLPKPLDNIDWTPVQNYIAHGIQEVANGEGRPKDFEHWIFESAMEAIYGSDIWKWWNSKS